MSEETPALKAKQTPLEGRSEGLSEKYCNKTFHSLLRQSNRNSNENAKPDPVYLFPRGTCPPVKDLPQSKSNLVHYQGDDSKVAPARKCRYIKDNVILKDDDNSGHKEINHYQKRRFQRRETDTSDKYSDHTVPNMKKNTNLSRRIKENYTNNPMNYMNQYQTSDYNTEQRTKMAPHTKAVSDYLSSQGVKKAFMSSQPETRTAKPGTTSINSVPASMLKTAIQRKQSEPYFARKGFKSYLIGNKNEVAFV